MNKPIKHIDNRSIIHKQLIIHKFNRKMKLRISDIQPYMSVQFGFIDPDFSHSLTSIKCQQQQMSNDIGWIPAQELHHICSYSKDITTLDQLSFSNKSIDYALKVVNWFNKEIFRSILDLQFDVLMDGIFMRMAIDSYIPINVVTNEPLFAKCYQRSIFPCIIQKLMAKLYGEYGSITQQYIDMVEMLTYYCREEISCTQGISIETLISIIQYKLDSQSIVCFRTRNSIRLQSFGMQSHQLYIILQFIYTSDHSLVQFLQLQGSTWIGKYSKLRSNWSADLNQLAQSNQVVLEHQQKQNYMSVADLKGIARQLIILNNTTQYHKNYVVCQKQNMCLSMYQLRVDQPNRIKIRINFKHKKCYNTILLIQLQPTNIQLQRTNNMTVSYRLVGCKFNQNKSSNYLQCSIDDGTYYIVVYNTHAQEHLLPYNLTIYADNTFPQLIHTQNETQIITVLEGTFITYFNTMYTDSKQPVILKHLYQITGFAFIFIRPNHNIVQVCLQMSKFKQYKIYPLNIEQQQCQNGVLLQQYRQVRVLCFYCQWSRKQNIEFQEQMVDEQLHKKVIFPPIGSIKVRLKGQNTFNTKTSSQ